MSKINPLLSIHYENQEEDKILTYHQELSPEEEVDDTEVNEHIEDFDKITQAEEIMSEIVDQQEVNMNLMETGSLKEGETSDLNLVKETSEMTEEEKESLADQNADEIQHQMVAEQVKVENLAGQLGIKSKLNHSSLESLYSSLGVNHSRVHVNMESLSSIKGRDRLYQQKQLYREQYEGFVGTLEKFGEKILDGIQALIDKLLEFLNSLSKIDFKKEYMAIDKQIERIYYSQSDYNVDLSLLRNPPLTLAPALRLSDEKSLITNLSIIPSLVKDYMDCLNNKNYNQIPKINERISRLKPLSFTGSKLMQDNSWGDIISYADFGFLIKDKRHENMFDTGLKLNLGIQPIVASNLSVFQYTPKNVLLHLRILVNVYKNGGENTLREIEKIKKELPNLLKLVKASAQAYMDNNPKETKDLAKHIAKLVKIIKNVSSVYLVNLRACKLLLKSLEKVK